jgi:arylsulfatase A-like enzyme
MGVVSNWDTGFPGFRGRITKRAGTLAEMLRPNGYNAYAVGKWHLAPTDEMTPVGPYDHWPLQRGFDRFYGFLDGATDQWTPDLVEDNHPIDPPRHDGYHLAEDLAAEATEVAETDVVEHDEHDVGRPGGRGGGGWPMRSRLIDIAPDNSAKLFFDHGPDRSGEREAGLTCRAAC